MLTTWVMPRFHKIQLIRRSILYHGSILLLAVLLGWLFTTMGLAVGWMIGAFIVGAGAHLLPRKAYAVPYDAPRIFALWKRIAQTVLAVLVGHQVTLGVVKTFARHYISMSISTLLTLAFSVFCGLLFSRWTKSPLLTSLYSMTPGGVSMMPALAEEAGANSVVVSVNQTIRLICVITITPVLATSVELHRTPGLPVSHLSLPGPLLPLITLSSVSSSVLLLLGALLGAYLGQLFRLPAPRIVGGILFTSAVQLLLGLHPLAAAPPFIPPETRSVAQILLGVSLGSTVTRDMFCGWRRNLFAGGILALLMTVGMAAWAMLCAPHIQVSRTTFILASAPGGVAEMALTALSMQSDTALVTSVQTLRLLTICLFLPPLFRKLHKLEKNRRSP